MSDQDTKLRYEGMFNTGCQFLYVTGKSLDEIVEHFKCSEEDVLQALSLMRF